MFTVSQARSRITDARKKITDLHREMSAELADIKALHDPHLSAEGLADRRAQRQQQLHEKYEPKIAQLRGQIDDDTRTLQDHLSEVRPKIGDDPASLMRMQTKWDQVRMRLEAGTSLQRVIESADADTLLAVAEWAPSWLSAQHDADRPQGSLGDLYGDADPSAVLHAVDRRLAEVAGDKFATAAESARMAAEEQAYASKMLPSMQMQAAGERVDPLAAALDAHYAGQLATVAPVSDADGRGAEPPASGAES